MYYVTPIRIAAMSTMIIITSRVAQLCSYKNIRDTSVVNSVVKCSFRHYFQGSWSKVLTHPTDWLLKLLHDICASHIARCSVRNFKLFCYMAPNQVNLV